DHLDLPGAPVSGDANKYAYADDSPMNGTDPTGYDTGVLTRSDTGVIDTCVESGLCEDAPEVGIPVALLGQGLVDLGGAALGGLFGGSSPAPSHNIFAGGSTQSSPVTGGFSIDDPPEEGCVAIVCGSQGGLLTMGGGTATTQPHSGKSAAEIAR